MYAFSIILVCFLRLNSILLPKVRFNPTHPVAYPGILFGGCSTNSAEDGGQREWGSGGW